MNVYTIAMLKLRYHRQFVSGNIHDIQYVWMEQHKLIIEAPT